MMLWCVSPRGTCACGLVGVFFYFIIGIFRLLNYWISMSEQAREKKRDVLDLKKEWN
jgi:hypothetical protein